MLRRRTLLPALGLALAAPPSPARAGDGRAAAAWPTQPVRIVLPFPPGGSSHRLWSVLQGPLAERLGQRVETESRAVAGGLAAALEVVRSRPDGHTLALVISSLAARATLEPLRDFDPVGALTPVAQFASVPLVVCCRPDLPVASLAELRDLAEARSAAGAPMVYASPGLGTSSHLLAELLRFAAGNFAARHLPVAGGGAILSALEAGEAEVAFPPLVTVLPHALSGRLRALAVSGAARAPQMPDVPVLRAALPQVARGEFGPSLDLREWFGLVGPAGMPQPVLARLHAALRDALAAPEVAGAMYDLGAAPAFRAGEAFRRVIRDDILRFHDIARRVGLVAA